MISLLLVDHVDKFIWGGKLLFEKLDYMILFLLTDLNTISHDFYKS